MATDQTQVLPPGGAEPLTVTTALLSSSNRLAIDRPGDGAIDDDIRAVQAQILGLCSP